MKNSTKIYILEIIISISIILSKIIINNYSSYLNIYLTINFIILTLIFYQLFGIQRANKRVKKVVTQGSIVIILSYIIVSFICGLLIGFVLNPINLSLMEIIKNIYGIVILIICEEFIRYIIAKKCINNKKLPLILITILFILMDIILILRELKSFDTYGLFVLFTTSMIPSIARNIVASYLCYHVSLLPGLIFRLFFAIYTYIFPVFPDVGNYINSIIGVLLPYILYLITVKYIRNYEKTKMTVSLKRKFWYLNIPFWSLTVILLILISGLFKYQIMAVGSGSMHPTIDYGDAVIYTHLESDKDYKELKKGDIIVFQHENKYIIHRIKKITINEGNITIQTKGDNNDDIDPYILSKKDLKGKVKTNIKFIGYPTVWMTEIFGK